MRCLSFNSEGRQYEPPRNWRVYDFALFEVLPMVTWELLRETIPTNFIWQIPGLEAFIL